MKNLQNNSVNKNNYQSEDLIKNFKIKKDKVYCILSYIYILWLVGLLTDKDNKLIRFHANQGIILSIFMFSSLFSIEIISHILFFIAPILSIITALLQICWIVFFLTLSVIGILNVIHEKNVPLPLIGNLFTVLK